MTQMFNSDFSSRGNSSVAVTTLLDEFARQFGVWVTNIRYKHNSVVYRHNGTYAALYRSLVDDNQAHLPELGVPWWEPFPSGALPTIAPFLPQWDPAYVYTPGLLVAYNGNIYLAVAGSTGVVPGTNQLVWKQVVSQPFLGEWSAAFTYATHQMVNSNGILYVALSANTGVLPSANPAVWTPLIASVEHLFLGEWSSTHTYVTRQMVNHLGKLYVCVALAGDTGTVPGTNWMVWYQKLPGGFLNQWSPTFQYIPGQAVHLSFFGIYECINGNVGENPNLFPVDWKLIIDTSGPWKEHNFVTVNGVVDYVLPDSPTPTLVSKMRVNISGGEMHYAAGHFTVAGAVLSFIPATLGFIPDGTMPVRVLYK